jgi:lipoic acid synthetase
VSPKPPWLKRRLPTGPDFENLRGLIDEGELHTVCQEAHCPNIWECFSHRTATFLIMGSRCTRNCRFCAVSNEPVQPLDPNEPDRVARAAARMGLTYIVVTSVTRDDLADGGAAHFAATIEALHHRLPDARIEVLVPDFKGRRAALQTVLNAGVDVLNHNLETIPRLYSTVRPQADYRQSLTLLRRAAESTPGVATKSGLMLGLGETGEEVQRVLGDLVECGCGFLTLGQYLQPSAGHLPVERYVPPEEFERWRRKALDMGFKGVASGPFVRSSYHAKDLYENEIKRKASGLVRNPS